MSRYLPVITGSILLLGCSGGIDTHDDIVRADLATIIESLGSPCDSVVEYRATEDLTYTVNCQTGQQYLLTVSPQGRVDLESH